MKSEYAIILYFDDHTNTIFQNMIDKIAVETGNYYMINNQIPPHVTIGAFFAEKEPKLSEFTEKINVGEIAFNDLGSFEPYVLFVAPEKNDYLRNCNIILSARFNDLGYEEDQLYTIDNWIPHLTLATKLNAEQIEKARSFANFTPFSGQVEKIALVKCNPFREIDCYGLGGGTV